ncbi:hypothetical protein SAMN05421855_1183 [Ulvibacter litoralis]|uniref:Uncharacterized protein n=1 Tax=Ulvibacter litoralis TaxID=227084 RepID=A0A1G7JLF3_9FLAO|nr:hypothetical protein SAMN05421855_1183 [Ulvibacter litoralis]
MYTVNYIFGGFGYHYLLVVFGFSIKKRPNQLNDWVL